ncbi:unnamed protein product [Spodoptera littoralis]|uniref:non-specific serine/threonine protein kinase n=1 Tax=Spodoptera littoralis TaxID=7109 RepID=A0A9P0HTC2_SPOLI|nr:unnamed protein product [Spodoptera littoralis]CAH1634956.1 unnamed protein product [Spodoptera littoralis]
MAEKLKDYQVIDVFCGGTFYKVKHKVTNNIFAWKAYDCSAFSNEQIQNVANEVKTISKVTSKNLLRYYDTIFHTPSKTLYFVLEYNSWRSVQELIEVCKATDKFIAESFIWYLLHELARVCKAIEDIHVLIVQKCITPGSIFVNESGELRINCFELTPSTEPSDVMRQIAEVIHTLCYRPGTNKIKEFPYSDDLRDIVSFLMDERNANMRPDVVLYHPTVLMNLETKVKPKCLNEIITRVIILTQLPRTLFNIVDSPIYCNISPKRKSDIETAQASSPTSPLSPTLAALALELPGFVPRSRRPFTDTLDTFNCPQQVSEETLSQQWMSRLIALRHREESLNKRERDLVAKEIVNSPSTKIIPCRASMDLAGEGESNGITLPLMLTQAKDDRRDWVSRRRRPRSTSVRSKGRRKSCGYEDLDSSLSADAGDGSIIVTGAKFTADNMPRRNIFPEVSTKKVHFTSNNPFTESDDSVTLTFYELDNVDAEGYQVPRQEALAKDISRFKYLDLKKSTSEKRASMQWGHSSPSKVAKTSKNVFGDITNINPGNMRKTPSKTSLTSRSSNTSRQSMFSCRSHWSMESTSTKVSDGSISERTRSAMRQCVPQTPVAPPDVKKSKSRKSLLNFKTPFKFMTSTKI